MLPKQQSSSSLTKHLWWVYIVRCGDGTYYTGSSNNLERRVAQHNAGTGAKYTKVRTPVTLVYFEPQVGRSSALVRELRLKKLSHVQKKTLVSNFT